MGQDRMSNGLCVMCGKKLTQKNKSVFKSVCIKCADKIEDKAIKGLN